MDIMEAAAALSAERGYIVVASPDVRNVGDIITIWCDGKENGDVPLRVTAITDDSDFQEQSTCWKKLDPYEFRFDPHPEKYYYRMVACD